MRIIEKPGAASHHRLAAGAEDPGKAYAGREVGPIRIVCLVGGKPVAKAGTEAGRGALEDTAIAFFWNREIVVANSNIDGEIRPDAVIVVEKPADLIGAKPERQQRELKRDGTGVLARKSDNVE